jgi:hypothetical protein
MSGMTRNWLILNTRSQEERWHHIMYSGLGTRRGNDQLLLPGDRWDEFCMAHSATTINENGICWQYAVARRVVQRSSTLLALESPWMSLTRDALWHNGMSPPREGRAREGDSP